MKPTEPNTSLPSRRQFLKSSGAAMLAGALARTAPGAEPNDSGTPTLRIGLVGCGGRGTGAAAQALHADPHVKLVALGDAFSDRLQSSLASLRQQAEISAKIDVQPERCFVGFDAYEKVIQCGVD